MAFKNVNQRQSTARAIQTSKMPVGEPITGYVVRIEQFTHEEKDYHNFVMRMKDSGEDVMIQTCGTLSYAVKDGKLRVGLLTQVTKTEDKNAKNKRTQFEILQDDEDTLDVNGPAPQQGGIGIEVGSARQANQAATDAAFDALGGGQPVAGSARSAIKSQASRMANSLKRG